VRPAAARRVQRVLQQHVGSRQLVDNALIPRTAPELLEPPTHDGFVFLFLRHDRVSPSLLSVCRRPIAWPLSTKARRRKDGKHSVSCAEFESGAGVISASGTTPHPPAPAARVPPSPHCVRRGARSREGEVGGAGALPFGHTVAASCAI